MGRLLRNSLGLYPVRRVFPFPSLRPDPGGPSPSDLTNLQFWVKGNGSQFALSLNDIEVSTWEDLSGNARHATGVVRTNKKPRWRQYEGPNSYPAILFVDAGGDGGHFTVPNFLTGFTAGHVWWVCKLVNDPPNVSDAAAPPCGDWGSGGDSYYNFVSDSKIYNDFGTNTRKTTNDPTSSLASWHVCEVETSSGNWKQRINGAPSGNDFFSTASNTVGWSTSPLLGRTATNAKYLRGWVSEIVFYSDVKGDSDRWNTVHTYLNNKYAFSLPTS